MTTTLKTSLAFLALAAFVTACSTNPPSIKSLGIGFLNAFNADANTEPVDASDVELTITPTAEPFNP